MKEFLLLYWSRLATEIESTGYKHKERERTFKQVGSHSSGGLAPNSTRQPGRLETQRRVVIQINPAKPDTKITIKFRNGEIVIKGLW